MSSLSFASWSQRTLALIGGVYLLVICLVVSVLLLVGSGKFEETFTTTTEVPNVGGGLPVGSDVKMRGLRIGEVSQIDTASGKATVTMELDPELATSVPASVQSRVLTANVFGVPFIELVPKGPEMPALTEGARIEPDKSREAIELAQIYETAYDVLLAIKPAKLNAALTAISAAFNGNGDEIGALLEEASSYLAGLTSHRAEFERDLVLLRRVVERADASAPVLLEALEDGAHLARTLVDNRDDLIRLLAVGADAVDGYRRLLDETAPRIISFVQATAPVFETMAAHPGAPKAALLGFNEVARKIVIVFRQRGGEMHVRAQLTAMPFPTYTATDCPRYGSLAGPNCPDAARRAPTYSGTVGETGSGREQNTLRSIVGGSASVDGLVALVAGPILRGAKVVTG